MTNNGVFDKWCSKCDIIFISSQRSECPICGKSFIKPAAKTGGKKVETSIKENEANVILRGLKEKYGVKDVCKILSRAYTLALDEKKEAAK